ncbi:hypothetical protein DB347_03800 [Opitutaceae bacterium EW11]|nr:hypothetical protein DB347_03800 [Opitutaceae bacterium EW11]
MFGLLAACARKQVGVRDVILSIEVQARNGLGVVDLAAAAPFPWDRVAIFEPHTTAAQMEQVLGFPWHSRVATGPAASEGEDLIVFCERDAVVAEMRFPASALRFCGKLTRRAFPRSQARFSVRRDVNGRTVLRMPDAFHGRENGVARTRP